MHFFPEWRTPKLGFVLLLLFLAMLGGCLPRDRSMAGPTLPVPRDPHHSARLSCFLMLKDTEGPAVRLSVSEIEVLSGDVWLPFNRDPVELDSVSIGDGQLFLGGQPMPPGLYQRLRLTVKSGTVRLADGKDAVIVAQPFRLEVSLVEAIQLGANDSSSIFLTWDVQNSLQPDNTLTLVLEAAPPLRQLPVSLLYVACPDIDTIFVVRADKNWVADSFGLKGHPSYLARDPDPVRQRLYVLAVADRAVKVVGLSSQRVIDIFPIQLNDAPTFMTISADGDKAYLLDERSGYLTCMDLSSGRNLARVRLGYRPVYAAFLEEQNLLAVSLALSQTVVLLDADSLVVLGSIPTGSSPQGLLAFNNRLYIAESGESSVSDLDLATRSGINRRVVGLAPRRLQASDSQIYISNHGSGSLSVLMPDQFGVFQEIGGLGKPSEMAFVEFYRRLYVADEKTESLAVLNTNSNLLVGRIALGAKPKDMAVIQ